MRLWGESTTEFYIEQIDNFVIKVLSKLAFNKGMKDRVWLFTV